MKKALILLITALTVTGFAAAQADIPDPGISPGSPFYSLDRASEGLELAVANAPLIGGPELAAKVRANHAAERLAEARKMTRNNKTEEAERMVEEYNRQMNSSVAIAARGQPDLASKMKNVSSNHVKVLEDMERELPAPARKGVQNAIENSRKNQEKLGKAVGRAGEPPSNSKGSGAGNPPVDREGKTGEGNAANSKKEADRDRNGIVPGLEPGETSSGKERSPSTPGSPGRGIFQ